jgi:hypothetical protein
MPLSTILQLYRGDQFYWWRKREYLEKTTMLHELCSFIFQLVSYLYILYTRPSITFLLKNLFCIFFFFNSFIHIGYQHYKIWYCLKNYYFRENLYANIIHYCFPDICPLLLSWNSKIKEQSSCNMNSIKNWSQSGFCRRILLHIRHLLHSDDHFCTENLGLSCVYVLLFISNNYCFFDLR